MNAHLSPCVFCNIINGLTDTELLFENDEICVFRDIKPASRYHILTVPKKHIEDVKSLTDAERDLVAKMYSVAKELVVKQDIPLENARFGYHWPPFRSVKHLHLHAMGPVTEMGLLSRLIFKVDSYWFVSPESVQKILEAEAQPELSSY